MSVFSDIDSAVTLDFETHAIESRPNYPPTPIGLAVRYPDAEVDYFAWGHIENNNCTLKQVRSWLADLWHEETPLLFFNASFDLSIAYEKLDLPILPWGRIHDAMFLAFLAEPHSRNLDLKSLAEGVLNWPPDEQDAIADYVWDNRKELVRVHGGKISRAKKGPNSAGAWISKCPVNLVTPYAIGDVERTHELFEHLYPIIAENGMQPAYDRERRVMPIFMANEREGVHVDLEALSKDVPKLNRSLLKADEQLRRMLRAPDLNINADAQLADALSSAGMIDDDDWVLTPSGQYSVSKDNLKYEMFNDEDVAHVFFYRNKLTTALSTFLEPWLKQAEARNGIISTSWNQVRGVGGGTRTGRPSTYNPNLLNIPKQFDAEYDMEPGNPWGLAKLPFARYYMLPDPGDVFIHRDFDGQEMRVFAHYEDGDLLREYQKNPNLDPHGWVKDEIMRLVGLKLERTPVKIMNFQALYGGGVPAAAKALGCSMAKAKEYKAFHDRALPGRNKLNAVIKEIVTSGEPIHTWGGRLYFPEPPRFQFGRMVDQLYKLINYLCQGSAADITKEALIRWHDHPKRDARFLVTVYDEINISAAKRNVSAQMTVLKEAMESIELDLDMMTTGKIGSRWSKLKKHV